MNIKKWNLVNKLKSFSIGLMLSTLTLPGVVNANVFVADGFNIVMTPDHFPIIWHKYQDYNTDFSVSDLELQTLDLCNAGSNCPADAIAAGAVYFKEFTVNGVTVVVYYDANGKIVGTSEGSIFVAEEYSIDTVAYNNYSTAVNNETNIVGKTAAAFEVNQSGSATYNIPILTPPGIGDFQSTLSLSYNSHSGQGNAGYGWNVTGFSAITRCNRTVAQDGLIDGINFTWGDALCLDGQRLVQVPVTSAHGGKEYRTEVDSFQKIIAIGDSGTGPAYFMVYTKSGEVREYGRPIDDYNVETNAYIELKTFQQNYTDSHGLAKQKINSTFPPPANTALAWALNSVKDRSNNTINYKYIKNTSNDITAFWPSSISYSYSGTAPVHEIKFVTVPRDGARPSYIRGFKTIQNQEIISNIQVFSNNRIIRDYNISHVKSASTGNILIDTVQECTDTSLNSCLAPIKFNWSVASSELTRRNLSLNWKLQDAYKNPAQFKVVDFDGDGDTDIFVGPTYVKNQIGTDVDGNPVYGEPDGQFRLLRAQNGTLSLANDSGIKGTTETVISHNLGQYNDKASFANFADVTGDGLLDMVIGAYGNDIYAFNGDPTYQFKLSPATPWHTQIYQYKVYPDRFFFTDVNHDSKTDILFAPKNGETVWRRAISTGGGFTYSNYYFSSKADTVSGTKFIPFDINGDGNQDYLVGPLRKSWYIPSDGSCDDSARGRKESVGNYKMYLSTSNGLQEWYNVMNNYSGNNVPWASPDSYGCQLSYNNTLTKPFDANGDGLTDLLFIKSGSNYIEDPDTGNGTYKYSGSFHVALNTGAGFVKGYGYGRSGLPYQVDASGKALDGYGGDINDGKKNSAGGGNINLMDVTGDGLADVVIGPRETDGRFSVLENTGSEFIDRGNLFPQVTETLFYFRTGRARTTDLNADGHPEILVGPKSDGSWTVIEKNDSSMNDILVGIVNGDHTTARNRGTSTTIHYDYFSHDAEYVNARYKMIAPDARCYSRDGHSELNFCGDEYRRLTAPVRVVSRVERENHLGGISSTEFEYDELAVSTKGRGMVGFGWRKQTDYSTGLVTETWHKQAFPYTGMPLKTVVSTTGGKKISETITEYNENIPEAITTDASGYKIYRPVATKTIKQDYEINNSIPYKTTTTYNGIDEASPGVYFVDEYGNSSRVITEVTNADNTITHRKITNSTYDNYPANWILGRLRTANVEHQVGSQTETRYSAFEYYPVGDYRVGKLEKEIANTSATDFTQKLETTYDYDAQGRKNEVSSQGWKATYNSTGVKTIVPMTARTTSNITIDVTHNAILNKDVRRVVTTNAAGDTETRDYSLDHGQLLYLNGPNQLKTLWSYDKFGRKRGEFRADGTSTLIDYQWVNDIATSEAATISLLPGFDVSRLQHRVVTTTTGMPDSAVYFDKFGFELRKTTTSLLGDTVYSDTTYNSKAQPHRQSRPYDNNAFEAYYSEFVYDAFGRVIQTKLPTSASTHTTTITAYNGLTTTVTNAKNQKTITVKNLDGKKAEVRRELDGTVLSTLNYAYTATGQIDWVQDANGLKTYMHYDAAGRKQSMTDPAMGYWQYEYNSYGELTRQISANHKKEIDNNVPLASRTTSPTTMQYDVLGRMTSRTEFEGTTTWVYGTTVGSIGKLLEVSGLNGFKTTYAYDTLLRPVQTTQASMNGTLSTRTVYDDIGRVKQEIRPDNLMIEYVYNSHGHLQALRSPKNQVSDADISKLNNNPQAKALAGTDYMVWWYATAADSEGRVNKEFFGNGFSTTKLYNQATGQLSSIQTGLLGSVQNLHYDYDELNNVTNRADHNLKLQEDFTDGYDGLNRLTKSIVTDNVSGNSQTRYFHYDKVGNLLDFNSTSATPVGSYNYDTITTGRLTSITGKGSYSYDANGNIKTMPGKNVTWSSFDKATRFDKTGVSSVITYDGTHSRVLRNDSSAEKDVTTQYFGKAYEHVKTTDKSGTTPVTKTEHKNYIYAGSRLIATYVKNAATDKGETNYMHDDALGSTNTITNASGGVVDRLSYTVFGERRAIDWRSTFNYTLALPTNRGYTGHEHIDAFKLINMNGRVYDPTIGRFLSADPHVQMPYNTQGFNRYAYVQNNPMKYTDPSGYFMNVVGDLMGGVNDFLSSQQGRQLMSIGFMIVAGMPPGAGELALTQYAGGAMLVGGVAAGIAGGDSNAILTGALSGLVFHHIGVKGRFTSTQRILLHGVVGGIRSVLSEGGFAEGFVVGAIGKGITEDGFYDVFDGPTYTDFESVAYKVASAAMIGGVLSQAGSGSFANGAMTGAYAMLFNELSSFGRSANAQRLRYAKGPIKPITWQSRAESLYDLSDSLENVATGVLLLGPETALIAAAIGGGSIIVGVSASFIDYYSSEHVIEAGIAGTVSDVAHQEVGRQVIKALPNKFELPATLVIDASSQVNGLFYNMAADNDTTR